MGDRRFSIRQVQFVDVTQKGNWSEAWVLSWFQKGKVLDLLST